MRCLRNPSLSVADPVPELYCSYDAEFEKGVKEWWKKWYVWKMVKDERKSVKRVFELLRARTSHCLSSCGAETENPFSRISGILHLRIKTWMQQFRAFRSQSHDSHQQRNRTEAVHSRSTARNVATQSQSIRRTPVTPVAALTASPPQPAFINRADSMSFHPPHISLSLPHTARSWLFSPLLWWRIRHYLGVTELQILHESYYRVVLWSYCRERGTELLEEPARASSAFVVG